MQNLFGFKLDYHYYVLKDYKNLFMQHIDPRFINKLFSDLTIIGFYTSYHDIDSLRENILDYFDIDTPLKSFKKDDLTQFINEFYINFNNSSNIIGENIDTEYNRIILPPLILSVSNELKYIGFSVKFYRRSEFIVEIFQNIDNAIPSENFESFNYSNMKIYKPVTVEDKKLRYIESDFNDIDKSIYEYLSIIEFNIFKVLKTDFFDQHFSILYFDNKMFNIKINSEIIQKLVSAPYIKELGNYFHKTNPSIQHYHYEIFAQKKILAATINKSKYIISESKYKSNRLKYTAINISYLLSALIPIHNKIFIDQLKLLRADKWHFNSLRDINLFNQFLSNINYNHTNLYTNNNHSINELYHKLQNSILNETSRNEINNIFEDMRTNSIDEKTNSTYLYI
ncbi:hypothetical protein G0010_12165, partial [Staphylococcus aureus]|uniref:hypothetical protein n=1 Tax=Staphylococcus aureus TaxID=1280 RepID=UPI0013B7527D